MRPLFPDGRIQQPMMAKPLNYSQQSISEDDIAAVVRVMRSPYLTQGPEVERFEASLCAYTGAKYAVAVSSGTAALHLAYVVAHKGRLMTSPLSFVATANAGLMAGMDVVFRDVDPATGNVSLPGYHDCLSVPVHFAGRTAPIPSDGKAVVVEDACHALGAMDFDGSSRVGSCAHSLASVFSFHAVKPITTGEGGAVTTNDEGFADAVRLLRSHGRLGSEMVELGFNYRLTDIQAALGTSQLERCDEMLRRRLCHSKSYHSQLQDFDDLLVLPGLSSRHAWHLYPVRIKNGKRDAVKAELNAQGIGAQVHYSPIIPLQPYYRSRFGYKEGDFPEAEAWAAETLSLPLHAKMTEADVTRVVSALREVLS
jgi:dTDP-4-amino-4,6-dideoxygalactose transaminase